MKKHIFTAMEFNAARPTKQVRKFRSERISKQLVKVSTRIIKKKFPVQQYIYIVVQHLNAWLPHKPKGSSKMQPPLAPPAQPCCTSHVHLQYGGCLCSRQPPSTPLHVPQSCEYHISRKYSSSGVHKPRALILAEEVHAGCNGWWGDSNEWTHSLVPGKMCK